ncbi:hypothetical protein K493DRAFT_343761 [Basidiobolus meristosporus CBS 931.73]|uniref:RGS domain-containing protein n=1 Tax=Basidiobolus meristosporus CBS 931.73 TaxID=1314790 RepID=A0A1Y1ZCP6_9FUNG|nr:hypothetical protein K493DRAFT_368540 [Basidiobolus meristosporus CBS 931.73]ORY07986.1 hypothetical protein K493DRAFT_343761 [Basidiobolus meristosporus CBS 931.73]|eukprot:ORX64233.1 hypothetical protein K493DRAFT_368540 [Basidiobolus meristosporus CBS 931.73]
MGLGICPPPPKATCTESNLLMETTPLLIVLLGWISILIISILLIYLNRKAPAIHYRGVGLLVASIIVNGFLAFYYIAHDQKPDWFPCFLMLWIPSLGIPLWFLVNGARFFKLAMLYKMNQAKLGISSGFSEEATQGIELASFHDYADKGFQSRFKKWYSQNQSRFSLNSIIFLILGFMLFHSLITVMIHVISKDVINQRVCVVDWEMIPVVSFHGIYVLLLFPGLVWVVWRVEDAHWIKRELMLVLIVETVNFTGRLVAVIIRMVGSTIPIAPTTWFTVATLVIVHSITIVFPVIDGWQETRSRSQINQASFQMMLDDPYMFQSFKLFSVKDFSVENVLFYEAYKRLGRNVKLRHKDAKTSQISDSVLVDEILQIYTTFIKSKSSFELNVPGRLRRELDITIEAGPPFSIQALEKIKEEVFINMYHHTYPRFVRETNSSTKHSDSASESALVSNP